MIPSPVWHVYMVRCRDDTLYTGIAKDLKKRITEHNSEKGGAKYTRSRKPVRLVYSEPAVSRSTATQREYQIKKMSPAQKRALIKTSLGSGNEAVLSADLA